MSERPALHGAHAEHTMIDVSSLRRSYTRCGLDEEQLTDHPMDLFERWLEEAVAAELYDPTAMVASTCDDRGQPFARTVLLKDYDRSSLVFYTNLGSRKARQLHDNPRLSLLFPWFALERQVIFLGRAARLSTAEALRYFATRPRDSQLGAWASEQSAVIAARSVLEGRFMEMKEKFARGEVPLPSFWGGFRVRIESVEFWQGRTGRLHDRFLYSRTNDDTWQSVRLAP